MLMHVFACLMTACAVHASAAGAALALAVMLTSSRSLHHNSLNVAFPSFNDIDAIGVSFLHALAFVSAITVSTLIRHG